MTDPVVAPSSPSNLAILWQELKRRTSRPAGELVFWSYFLAGIVILGGFGILLEASRAGLAADADRDWSNLYTAMLTYSPAIAGPALLQMLYEAKQNRRVTAFVVIAGTITAALVIALFIFGAFWGGYAWTVAALACFGAAWLWWVANADNANLHDEPDAPLGGSPTAPLSGGYGNFKV